MRNSLKSFLLLAALTSLFVGAGSLLGGRHGLMIGLGLGLVMNLAGYWFSDKIALAMSGAQEVGPSEAPRLHAVVSRLCQRAHLPMPRLYVTPEMQPNAFATGRNARHSAVAVTAGLMEMLDEAELEGVLAHELAHIKNRDILISSIAAMLAGAISQMANIFQWGLLLGGGRDEEEGGDLLGGILMMVLAPLGATLIQLAISRSREFEADRVGAQICGRPMALANALLKLQSASQRIPMMSANPGTAHMYIVNPISMGMIAKLFSTHPPIEERVEKLRRLPWQGA